MVPRGKRRHIWDNYITGRMKGHKGKIGCVVSILIACPHGRVTMGKCPRGHREDWGCHETWRLIGNYIREIQEHPAGQGCPHSHHQRGNYRYGVRGKRLRVLLEVIILVWPAPQGIKAPEWPGCLHSKMFLRQVQFGQTQAINIP